MFIQKILAAGVVALTALATTAPAQAESFSFGIYGDHIGVTFRSSDSYRPVHGRNYRPQEYRRRDYAYYRMTPRQVRRSLRHRGFQHIRFTDARGQLYRARATGPRGRRVAMTIRSRDGRIVKLHRIRRH